jgi:hypothetical protein
LIQPGFDETVAFNGFIYRGTLNRNRGVHTGENRAF